MYLRNLQQRREQAAGERAIPVVPMGRRAGPDDAHSLFPVPFSQRSRSTSVSSEKERQTERGGGILSLSVAARRGSDSRGQCTSKGGSAEIKGRDLAVCKPAQKAAQRRRRQKDHPAASRPDELRIANELDGIPGALFGVEQNTAPFQLRSIPNRLRESRLAPGQLPDSPSTLHIRESLPGNCPPATARSRG